MPRQHRPYKQWSPQHARALRQGIRAPRAGVHPVHAGLLAREEEDKASNMREGDKGGGVQV